MSSRELLNNLPKMDDTSFIFTESLLVDGRLVSLAITKETSSSGNLSSDSATPSSLSTLILTYTVKVIGRTVAGKPLIFYDSLLGAEYLGEIFFPPTPNDSQEESCSISFSREYLPTNPVQRTITSRIGAMVEMERGVFLTAPAQRITTSL